jgi:hypothetical protein
MTFWHWNTAGNNAGISVYGLYTQDVNRGNYVNRGEPRISKLQIPKGIF